MNNKLIMESWRNFVSETTESGEYLTEQELEEIFGKAAWEKMVDRFAVEDDGAADLARRLGLKDVDTRDASGERLDVAQIEDKVKQALAVAQQTKDPEVIDAAQKLAVTADQAAPELELEPAGASPDADASAEEKPEASGGFELDRSLLMNIVKNPDAKVGPAMVFRSRLTKYLQSVGLPRSINRMSPVVQGILNIVRQAALAANPSLGSTNLPAMGGTAGSPSLSANLEESIENIFIPIILEEVRREKTRRILIEITQKVAK